MTGEVEVVALHAARGRAITALPEECWAAFHTYGGADHAIEAIIRAYLDALPASALEALRADNERLKADRDFWENRENEALKRAERADAEIAKAVAEERERCFIEGAKWSLGAGMHYTLPALKLAASDFARAQEPRS